MSKIIILIGLPGSGKSTYAKWLLKKNKKMKYVSSDKMREELYGDASIQGDPSKIFRLMHKLVKEYLTSGFDVIYDATNVTRKNRKSIIDEVKDIQDLGIEGHVVWAPFRECISRDYARERTVGSSIVRKFLLRWESPYFDEGFTKIRIIHNEGLDFDSAKYKETILADMEIPHDNPHHRLSIAEHSRMAGNYARDVYFDHRVCSAVDWHDIGKPITKIFKIDKDGNVESIAHFYQHDNAGGYMVYGFYPPRDNNEAVFVSWLISNHMQPYFNTNYYKNLDPELKKFIDQVHEADVYAH